MKDKKSSMLQKNAIVSSATFKSNINLKDNISQEEEDILDDSNEIEREQVKGMGIKRPDTPKIPQSYTIFK